MIDIDYVRNTAYFVQMFILREVNSDMPIYILTEQMSEKIKCPEGDSNPRHPDLMEGALTSELPRQPQWSESTTTTTTTKPLFIHDGLKKLLSLWGRV